MSRISLWHTIFRCVLLITLFCLPTDAMWAQGTVIIETISSQSLDDNFLGDSPDRSVAIYLPPDYDTNTNKFYPVIYLLHGYTHNHLTWLKSGKLNMDIEEMLNDLIRQEIIKPVIVVMPNCYNKYQGSWYTNSIVTGDWEDFIVADLITFIENNYRALAQRESRGIAGHSMGGTGSFKIAMKHPEVYSAIFSLSAGFISFEHSLMGSAYKPYLINAVSETNPAEFGSLDWRERVAIAAAASFAPNKNRLPYFGDFPVDVGGALIDTIWTKWLEHDAYTMINSYKSNLSQLNGIWIDCGTNDDLYDSNYQLCRELDSAGVDYTWDEYSGGHTDKIGQRIEEKMLPFFSENLITSLDYRQDKTPANYILQQNYPNPFNPETVISWQLAVGSMVKLSVYDVFGEKVATLVSKRMNPGNHTYTFNGKNMASGIYFYKLTTESYQETRKMILIK